MVSRVTSFSRKHYIRRHDVRDSVLNFIMLMYFTVLLLLLLLWPPYYYHHPLGGATVVLGDIRFRDSDRDSVAILS